MKTLAQFKRECIGIKLTLVRHDGLHQGGDNINTIREVVASNTWGCELEGGSWLKWPKAKHVKIGNGFLIVDLNKDGKFTVVMRYVFNRIFKDE